ncbi:MAG TPA: FtsX-like permease family protein [Myxococcota bacterium]|nr:FtsX-like permease family protein [Myxococcota bacterium]
MLLKLAARNLIRHRRRTGITVFAIAGGLALMVLSITVGNGVYVEMLDQGITKQAGHVVVQAIGFQDERERHQVVENAPDIEAALLEAAPDGKVLSRTWLRGLLTSTTNAVGAAVAGVQPSAEIDVTDWDEKLVEGEWLADDDERGIVLGAGLAQSLGVELGDKVVLMVQGDDEVDSRLFRVRGVLSTGSADIDGFLAMAHIDATRELLPGIEPAHQVSLHLEEDTSLQLAGVLQVPDGSEVLTWKEALPELVEYIRIDRKSNDVFMIIIGLIVTIGVLNTVLMSVLERVREFGVMLAVGMTPGRLFTLVVTEGLLLGLVGMALGVLGGAALSYPLVTSGLDYTGMMGGDNIDVSGVTVSMVIYGVYDWLRVAHYALGAVLLTLSSTLYPAIKASRLQPVDAMRHI